MEHFKTKKKLLAAPVSHEDYLCNQFSITITEYLSSSLQSEEVFKITLNFLPQVVKVYKAVYQTANNVVEKRYYLRSEQQKLVR